MSERIYFGKLKEAAEPPNLIEVQLNSYVEFLQKDVLPRKRKDSRPPGRLQGSFPHRELRRKDRRSTSSATKSATRSSAPLECQRESQTFCRAAPRHLPPQGGEGRQGRESLHGRNSAHDAAGHLRHQRRRARGRQPVAPLARHLLRVARSTSTARCSTRFRIIPDRGSWLEVQFDTNDLLYVYLDRRKRRRKFLATTFLRALGYGDGRGNHQAVLQDRGPRSCSEKLEDEDIATKVLIADVRDGEITRGARAFEPLTKATIRQLLALGIKTVKVVDTKDDDTIIKCLKKDPAHDEEEALKDIYRRLRPGDPPTVTNARGLLKRLFFDPKNYDLGRVGRYKINQKLGIDVDLDDAHHDQRRLHRRDASTSSACAAAKGSLDDIDHLGSRRVRTVGELLANQCRVGLARTERLVKERMTLFDVNIEGMTPQKLINPKALSRRDPRFLRPQSQLSQFMDQTNPLAELTHKRRLSALGPGGLSRDRAGFEVRDVHPSHYGRICPIETPEGPNIGLIIVDVVLLARINEFGFIETPYRKVDNGRVTDTDRFPHRRPRGELPRRPGQRAHRRARQFHRAKRSPSATGATSSKSSPTRVNYMDVSPKQLVSVAASLIPFLEHDDANRALMGSNMQRQGVPLLVTRSAAGRHRHGRQGRPRFPRRHRRGRPTARSPVVTAQLDHRHQGRRTARGQEEAQARPRGGHLRLRAAQVHALERRHLREPEADRQEGPDDPQGRGHLPTAPTPSTANSPSAATCSSRSCRGTATTSRTPS